MGWLELLALLKRVLPLLDRLAPVLESAVAGRFSGRAEAERLASAALAETGRVTSAAVAEVTRSHAALLHTMEEQRAETLLLREQVDLLRSESEHQLRHLGRLSADLETANSSLETTNRQLAALLKVLRAGLVTVVVLLAVAVSLLLLLLLRRRG